MRHLARYNFFFARTESTFCFNDEGWSIELQDNIQLIWNCLMPLSFKPEGAPIQKHRKPLYTTNSAQRGASPLSFGLEELSDLTYFHPD